MLYPSVVANAADLQNPAAVHNTADSDESRAGRVLFVKGDVTHTRTFRVVNPPAKDSPVFAGDVFTTGKDGFVTLSFTADSSINIQPDSQISIANIDCADKKKRCEIIVNVESGEAHSEVTPRADNETPVNFKVVTPYLSAAVRGTAFYVDASLEFDLIGVTQGSVATSSNGVDNTLPKGKGIKAIEGVQPTVVDLLDAPELTVDPACREHYVLSNEDVLRWNDITGADKYRVDYSLQSSTENLILKQEVDRPFTQHIVSAPGKYLVSVRGIDEQGFLGLPTSDVITVAQITETETVELSVHREDNLVIISSPGYKDPVELKIYNSFDSGITICKNIEDLSNGISVRLDSTRDWILRARKRLGETSVSRYSLEHVLEANNQP